MMGKISHAKTGFVTSCHSTAKVVGRICWVTAKVCHIITRICYLRARVCLHYSEDLLLSSNGFFLISIHTRIFPLTAKVHYTIARICYLMVGLKVRAMHY